MKSCFSDIFGEILARSADGLFRDRGALLPPAAAKPVAVGEQHVAAVVGFRGSQVSGSLMVMSPFDLAAKALAPRRPALAPAPVLSARAARDWIVVRDWMGEVANQLLGRVKNRLVAFGVEFQVATPVPLSGRGLSLALQRHDPRRVLAFGRGEELLQIVPILLEEPTLVAVKAVSNPENPALEGEVIEF